MSTLQRTLLPFWPYDHHHSKIVSSNFRTFLDVALLFVYGLLQSPGGSPHLIEGLLLFRRGWEWECCWLHWRPVFSRAGCVGSKENPGQAEGFHHQHDLPCRPLSRGQQLHFLDIIYNDTLSSQRGDIREQVKDQQNQRCPQWHLNHNRNRLVSLFLKHCISLFNIVLNNTSHRHYFYSLAWEWRRWGKWQYVYISILLQFFIAFNIAVESETKNTGVDFESKCTCIQEDSVSVHHQDHLPYQQLLTASL